MGKNRISVKTKFGFEKKISMFGKSLEWSREKIEKAQLLIEGIRGIATEPVAINILISRCYEILCQYVKHA